MSEPVTSKPAGATSDSAVDTKAGGNPYAPLAKDGRTMASWVGSMGALLGFIVMAIGFFMPGISKATVITGVVIAIASAIAGGVLKATGHGVNEP